MIGRRKGLSDSARRVAIAHEEGGVRQSVEGKKGGAVTPVIGGVPDKKTQSIPLLDIIAEDNPPLGQSKESE